MHRRKGLEWAAIQLELEDNKGKLWTLNQMEITNGEPDVACYDRKTGKHIFYDCLAESPRGRSSVCYDHEALDSRQENKPENSAVELASDMGIGLLSEDQYRQLQSRQMTGEHFDIKTSSWIITPAVIRKLGGALFCYRLYNTIFVYHNGAESYYAGRGFRSFLRV